MRRLAAALAALALAVAAAACDDPNPAGRAAPSEGDFGIVVSVPILAALVDGVVGDDVTVTSLVPPGADPHEYRLPESEIEQVADADVLLVVGQSFDPAFPDLLAAAGPDTEVGVAVQALERPVTSSEGTVDPHFWHDPVQAASAVQGIGEVLAAARPSHATEYREAAQARARGLRNLGFEIARMVEVVPEARRGLVTQHDFLRYFAARYDFRVVATIIPGLSSEGEPTANSRLTVKEALEARGVCAVFDPESSPSTLSEVVVAEAETQGGDVEVVSLLADTMLDGATTYAEMVRENARRIVEALVGCG